MLAGMGLAAWKGLLNNTKQLTASHTGVAASPTLGTGISNKGGIIIAANVWSDGTGTLFGGIGRFQLFDAALGQGISISVPLQEYQVKGYLWTLSHPIIVPARTGAGNWDLQLVAPGIGGGTWKVVATVWEKG